MSSRFRAFARLAAVPVWVALAAGCNRGEANEAGSALQTSTVERRTIVSSVNATGTIEPIRVIDVKSQASGEILELAVELGDAVDRGDLLVRIDPRDVRNAFEQAEADLDVARARIEVARRQLERTQALRDSAIVTEEELESALLEHANARAALVKAETNLELAREKLEDVTLRAPIAGTVVELNVEEGQIITGAREVTGGTVLLRMADLAEMQVRTLVDETDIGRVKPGLPASTVVEAHPDRTFRGTVIKIEPQAVVEQNVTMFAVLTRIVNEGDLLRPGMNADVEMVIGREEGVLSLPNAAVKTPEEARQLAQALGLDPAGLAEARRALEAGAAGAAGEGAVGAGPPPGAERADRSGGGAGPGGAEAGGPDAAGAEAGLPSPAELRAMSQEERRRLMQNLSPADRQRLFQRFREEREAEERADRADPSRPRPAFVFQEAEDGGLRPVAITVGLSSWDHTRVVSGLEGGERVVELPLSLVQQQELLDRFRSRSGVPGVQRN